MMKQEILSLVLNNFSICTVLAISLALLYQWWRRPHPNFPPGFRGLPFLGVTLYLGKNAEKVFKRWSLEMNAPVISVRLGSKDAVVLNTAEAIQEVLVKQSAKVASRPYMHAYSQVVKNRGIVFTDFNETYKKQRTFVLKHLKKSFGIGSAAMENAVNEEVSRLIRYLRDLPQGSIRLSDHIFRTSCNVVLKVIAGKHYDFNDVGLDKTLSAIKHLIGESEDASKIVTLNLFAATKYVPPFKGANERALKNWATLINDLADPIIEEHKKNFDPDNLKDYVDAYLHEQEFGKDKQCFNENQLRFCIIDLTSAGSDTTSSTLSWDVLCYLHHPRYQDSMQKEVDSIIGENEYPTMSMRGRMPITCAFLHEAIRYRSAIEIVYRKANEAVSVMGHTIPIGTTILSNTWGAHNDPKSWDKPEEFNPQRYISESGEFVPSSNVIPFGAGYRRCPGENLAKMEEFIIFTKLLQNFHIKSATEKLPDINDGFNNLLHCPIPYEVNLLPRQ